MAEGPKSGSEARFLRGFPTFERFSSGELNKVVRAADRVSLPANWPLIHEQTPGDACYILLSGKVAVYAGREPVAELGPGDVVGEVAIRQGRLRSATVSTTEAVEMLRIEGEDLTRLLRELPALRDAMDATAAEHGGGPAGS
ncbi:MAG: cyclic nucleotide-binding domain-containing protein [Actinophytocola sp.]|nr:cyclic nucleotide-binding domain-containing protein [Actinophytocola sp.]